jgi:hypothetical protein
MIDIMFWLLAVATVVGTILDFAQGGTQRLVRGPGWRWLRITTD